MRPRTFYEILEVDPKATEKTIKDSYHNLALKHHPDKVKQLSPDINEEQLKIAKERFQDISNAYETLIDKEKRKAYDSSLSAESDLSSTYPQEKSASSIPPFKPKPKEKGPSIFSSLDEGTILTIELIYTELTFIRDEVMNHKFDEAARGWFDIKIPPNGISELRNIFSNNRLENLFDDISRKEKRKTSGKLFQLINEIKTITEKASIVDLTPEKKPPVYLSIFYHNTATKCDRILERYPKEATVQTKMKK